MCVLFTLFLLVLAWYFGERFLRLHPIDDTCNSTATGFVGSWTVDGVLLAGFGLSAMLNLCVWYAVSWGVVAWPAANHLLIQLCASQVAQGLLGTGQVLTAQMDCKLADGAYVVVSSLQMVAQSLSFMAAAALAVLASRVLLSHGAEDVSMSWRVHGPLAALCCVPGATHLVLCLADEQACPSNCGYAQSKTTLGEQIKRGNELGSAALMLLCILGAAVAPCMPRVRRAAPYSVRHRHLHRLVRYLGAFTLLWGAIIGARFADGKGPFCIWAWLLTLQGYQGALDALLLSPQVIWSPLRRFVSFSRPEGSTRTTPPERPSPQRRHEALRASRRRTRDSSTISISFQENDPEETLLSVDDGAADLDAAAVDPAQPAQDDSDVHTLQRPV